MILTFLFADDAMQRIHGSFEHRIQIRRGRGHRASMAQLEGQRDDRDHAAGGIVAGGGANRVGRVQIFARQDERITGLMMEVR